MKKEHQSHSSVIRLVGGCLLCALAVGVWYLNDADGAGQNDRQGESGKRAMSVAEREGLKRKSKVISAERALELEREYDAIFSRLLARHPGLEPEWKSVPDEKNGFLQWLNFCDGLDKEKGKEPDHFGFKLPEEIGQMLRGKGEWDTEKMRAYIESHAEMFQEMTRIGLMQEQSSAGIPPRRYLKPWAIDPRVWISRTCIELLCADARLAAESGDQQRAFLRVRAAMGLIRHVQSVELTTHASEIFASLAQLHISDTTLKHVFPVVDQENVAAWRDVLTPLQPKEDYGSVIRGDFFAGIRVEAIPQIAQKGWLLRKHEMNNPDRLYDVWAQRALNLIDSTSGLSHQDIVLSEDADFAPNVSMEHLSEGEKETFPIFGYRWSIRLNQGIKFAARSRQQDAALAILEGSEPPVELVTGKPFVFDPDTRTLSFPDDPLLEKIKAEPITLP